MNQFPTIQQMLAIIEAADKLAEAAHNAIGKNTGSGKNKYGFAPECDFYADDLASRLQDYEKARENFK